MAVTRQNWTNPQPPTHPGYTPQAPPVLDEGIVLADRDPRPEPPPVDWRTVPLPESVAVLPRDRRGYPIFATIAPPEGIPEDGRVDFRVLNVVAHIRAARERRCGVCGERLGPRLVFTGGPMCVKARIFGDMALHQECADYARRVCPFLVNDQRQYDTRETAGTTFDPNVITTRPQRLVLYYTTGYRLLPAGQGKTVLLVPPADWVEWFDTSGVYRCRTRPTMYAQ